MQSFVDDHALALAAEDLSDADQASLAAAVKVLERPSLPGRLSAIVGRQVDFAEQFIPEGTVKIANRAAGAALRVALRVAIGTLPKSKWALPRLHTALAAMSGAAGGAFGLATLPIELPLSTTIILRAIAEVARGAGEDIDDPTTALACLEVFALGGGREAGPASNSGYLAIRSMLAKSVQQATRVMLQRGLADESAPALMRFLGQIVSRFGVVVSQKAMAQAVPIVGAVAGAAINAAFAEHYTSLAKAHFEVRRLERVYGAERVERAYRRILDEMEPVGPPPDRHTHPASGVPASLPSG